MTTNFFNPEDLAKQIMNKSFLKSRENKRQQGTGSQFFQDNKIRSCSYVKQSKGGLKAIPYYDKRNYKPNQTSSDSRRSWSSTVHSNQGQTHAGGYHQKKLSIYDPKASRNLMNITDHRPPYPNSSHIQFGTRSNRDTKHYMTTNMNNMIFQGKKNHTNNPAIQASQNQWLRSRQQK